MFHGYVKFREGTLLSSETFRTSLWMFWEFAKYLDPESKNDVMLVFPCHGGQYFLAETPVLIAGSIYILYHYMFPYFPRSMETMVFSLPRGPRFCARTCLGGC